MIPIYSLTAFFSMVFLQASIEFELVRSIYEAVVLGSFLILLMNLMGGQDGAVALLTGLPSDMYFNAPPLCCCCCCFCPEVFITKRTWRRMQLGIMQYSVVRPVTVLIALPLYYTGHYVEGQVDKSDGYIYINIIQLVSLFTALYFLFVLWKATRKTLLVYQTGLKFLAIKLIVFLSTIQSLIITLLEKGNVIKADSYLNVESRGYLWANWLICFEMMLTAFIFLKGYPVTDYQQTVGFELTESSNATALVSNDKLETSGSNNGH